MKYYEINETAAAQAREMWSFSDYKHGSKTAEYKAQVDEVYKIAESLPDELKERGEAMADRYARKLAEWYNKQFAIEMMCPSIMIVGGGNFPVRKKEKQNAAQDRHYKLFDEIQAIPEKIKRLASGPKVIKAGDADAIEQLQKKLEKLEKNHEYMKAANTYYRKHKTLKGFSSLTDEKAAELDNAIKSDCLYNAPFAPYQLTNNNAKIKNTKARIAQLTRLKNGAESAAEQQVDEYTAAPFKVVENAEIMRLQLFFEDKPAAGIREVLKKNGFRWSPKNSAWQRQLTDNAKYAVKRVIEQLQEA